MDCRERSSQSRIGPSTQKAGEAHGEVGRSPEACLGPQLLAPPPHRVWEAGAAPTPDLTKVSLHISGEPWREADQDLRLPLVKHLTCPPCFCLEKEEPDMLM